MAVGPASVSAKKLPPTVLAPSPFPVTPSCGCPSPRSGVSPKRFFPSSYRNMLPVRPLCSTGVTPLPRSYGPLRLPARAAPWLCIPSGRSGSVALPRPCRVSQVPRLIYSCALSPTTPEGPTSACSLLPRRYQASSSSADWPPSLASRGRIRFACATARRFASPVSTSRIAPTRSGSATCTNEQFTW